MDFTLSYTSWINLIGYIAAVVTNICMYPQAYNIRVIIYNKKYNQLSSLSSYSFFLQIIGCILWILYSSLMIPSVVPIMVGSTLCLIPSIYIWINIIKYKGRESSPQILII